MRALNAIYYYQEVRRRVRGKKSRGKNRERRRKEGEGQFMGRQHARAGQIQSLEDGEKDIADVNREVIYIKR